MEEIAERSFGDRLVEAGLLTRAQLADALDVQQVLARLGEPRWLGELLVLLGYVSAELVAQHVATQAPVQGAARLRRAERGDAHNDGALGARLGDCLTRLSRLILYRPPRP